MTERGWNMTQRVGMASINPRPGFRVTGPPEQLEKLMEAIEDMAKPTITSTRVMLVEIKGVKREPRPYKAEDDPYGMGPLPVCPDDQGIVKDVLEWSAREERYPVQGIMSGGGSHIALWHPRDAAELVAYVQEKFDVEIVDHKPIL